MRAVYRFFAGLIALEVLVQAAAVAYGFFGVGKYIDDGHTINKAAIEDANTSFTGLGGLALHGINGMMVIPLIGLLFLIVSFFAKVPKGVMWALITFVLIIVQVALGLFAHGIPALGILHGPNALLLFGVAVMALMRARDTAASAPVVGQPTASV
jgi:hypothetical protein